MGKYYVYGMGRIGIRVYLGIKDSGSKVIAFVDSDSKKHGKYFDGVKCISLEEFLRTKEDEDVLIIAIQDETVTHKFEDTGVNAVYYKKIQTSLDSKKIPMKDIEEINRMYMYFCKGADCINEYIAGK
ncbi:hypothetical protein SAMN02910377_01587 [Pseudobutyrivibrio ruminis]|uniref:Uncharacterized protein n=1 Tax=Pseudobutyrivibrio ruminis TaxID=46206 RepID=A0A1H7J993_9FIRM|nr:hypothetical protein [Pseudobutyrivibrio ruminis]SEK70550.1 hypothetical protein SAMN02910377_01587 [Pseudobutyrivibrio ruminis]